MAAGGITGLHESSAWVESYFVILAVKRRKWKPFGGALRRYSQLYVFTCIFGAS